MDVDRDVHACLRLCNRPGDDWPEAIELGHLHTAGATPQPHHPCRGRRHEDAITKREGAY
jgi:hypothetical protein